MSSLVDRFKSGASKAAFEADKLRRLQMAQSAAKPLRAETERLYYALGLLTFRLYTEGNVQQPELRTAGEQLAAQQARIAAADAEIERIRAEEHVEPLPGRVTQGSLICPAGHGPLAGSALYCQTCGSAGIQPAIGSGDSCQRCGETLEAAARFCAVCGAPVERCVQCDTPLLTDALFCATCGTPARNVKTSATPDSGAGDSARFPAGSLDLPADQVSDDEEYAGRSAAES